MRARHAKGPNEGRSTLTASRECLFGLHSVTLDIAWRSVAYGVTTGNSYDRGELPRSKVGVSGLC